MQEAAMIMMADSRGELGRDAAVRRVRDAATARSCSSARSRRNPLRDICAALEIADLSLDPRFATCEQQFEHKAELQRMFRERFASNTREHWLARLEEQDLLCAPVRDLREALVDPQTLHNEMILEGGALGGRPLRFIASPIQHVGAPRRPAPRAAAPGRAHRRGAGRSARAGARRPRMSVRLRRRATTSRTVTHRPARRAQRGRPRRPRPS